jgi:hypothetical protein
MVRSIAGHAIRTLAEGDKKVCESYQATLTIFEINIPCLHLVYFPPHGSTSEARIDSDPNGAISDHRTPSCRISWL